MLPPIGPIPLHKDDEPLMEFTRVRFPRGEDPGHVDAGGVNIYTDPSDGSRYRIIPDTYATEICDYCGKKRRCHYIEEVGVPSSRSRRYDACMTCLKGWKVE